MTHTPTPWEFAPGYDNTDGDRALGGIVGADGTHIARIWSDQEHAEVDAQFIVTACNAHEELVEALETLLKLSIGPTVPEALLFGINKAKRILDKVNTIEKGV